MIRSLIKSVAVLCVLDAILFVCLMASSMTDEKPPAIAGFFYWFLQHILGFPLVLLNNEWPFFIESSRISLFGIFLVILNNTILGSGFIAIRKALK